MTDNMRKEFKKLALFFVLMIILTSTAYAQFEEPEIVKVETEDKARFQSMFSDIKWTGQGFNPNKLDRIPAIEIRAHLQSAYGEPTQTIEDVAKQGKFRAGKAIQFEYWFIIDGKIPMMVLDLDGPFEKGLVYVGASRYIDLMPQVKRTFTRTVTEAAPKEYKDYFFSPERQQWYQVTYKDGKYSKEEIDKPPHIKLN